MAVMFDKMVMAGVGLICGSLALDMRRHKLVKEIVGYGRSEGNLKLAKKKRIIDSYFLREADFPGSGVVEQLIANAENILTESVQSVVREQPKKEKG